MVYADLAWVFTDLTFHSRQGSIAIYTVRPSQYVITLA